MYSTCSSNSSQSNQVKRTPQDYINKLIIWILNSLLECNSELIIEKLNPLVVPRILLMGLMLKKIQFNIDFLKD